MINRVPRLAAAALFATSIATFITTSPALSRELAIKRAEPPTGWGGRKWVGWSGAGWGFVGPGGGKGWMGNGWGWRGVGPYIAPIHVSRAGCRHQVSTRHGRARSLVCR
jgi:hypothetical protein